VATPPDSELFLGLDVGTQATKGLVIDLAARSVVARASAPHAMVAGLAPGAAEQEPATWWDAVRAVVARLVAAVDPARLAGIGVSGQQHGFVPLDAAGEVIRPAKLWCDTSTADEAEELSRLWGRRVPAGFTASKVLWMMRREPERFARLATILLPHEWVNLRLTGRMSAEHGDASGTGYFDPVERTWRADELAALDARLPEALPPLLAPGEPAGRVTPAAARELGLPAGVMVAPGGGDNMLSAIGSGATRPGVVVVSLGTSGTVFTYSPRPVVDPEGLIAPFCDSTGGWLPLLCTMNVTGVTEEVRAAFGMQAEGGLEHLTRLAAEVPPGCDGLLFLPYLVGERVPDLPRATGTLLGLRPGLLRPAHLFRAALEGTSQNLAWGTDRLRALGIEITSVRLVGGAARNPLWRQILADCLATPVTPLAEPESAALGAALQAAWSAERQDAPTLTADEIAAPFVRPEAPPQEPSPERTALYRALAERFRAEAERTRERG